MPCKAVPTPFVPAAAEVVRAARIDVAQALVPTTRPFVQSRGEERQVATGLGGPPQCVTDQGVAVAPMPEVLVGHQVLELGDAARTIDGEIGVGSDLVAVVHREQRQLRAVGLERSPVCELTELLIGGVRKRHPPVPDDRRSELLERQGPHLVCHGLDLRTRGDHRHDDLVLVARGDEVLHQGLAQDVVDAHVPVLQTRAAEHLVRGCEHVRT